MICGCRHCEFIRVDTRKDFIEALGPARLDLIFRFTMGRFQPAWRRSSVRGKNARKYPLFAPPTSGDGPALEGLKKRRAGFMCSRAGSWLITAVDRPCVHRDRAERERGRAVHARGPSQKYREVFECLGDLGFWPIEKKTGKIMIPPLHAKN